MYFPENSFTYKKNNHSRIFTMFGIGIVVLIVISIFLLNFFSGIRLSEEKRITIPQGFSATRTAELLKTEGVIRSPLGFRFFYRSSSLSVKAGTYLFEEGTHKLSDVVQRLHSGDYGDVFIQITLREGISIKEMADIFEASSLTSFDKNIFLASVGNEGYFFPDTYLLLPETETEELINILTSAFDKKIEPLLPMIESSSRSLSDFVTMASLIEKEAGSNLREKKIVAGILWKRLDRGMLLQVDAPFVYYQGKGSHQLSIADLQTDHPYNTYTRIGLPPTPIGNPGLSALEAAILPESSPYFYYLHDTIGNIHYGVTHDDHVRNKQRYLR